MKMINRIFTVMLALLLVVSLAVPAMAEGETNTCSITINGTTNGHVYEAYQIFTGDLYSPDANSAPILSNIAWGTGVTEYGGTPVAQVDASAVAATLSESTIGNFPGLLTLNTAEGAHATATAANNKAVFSNLHAGYYLVKQKDGSLGASVGDAYTAFIIKVAGNAEASPKVNVPRLVKYTADINDYRQSEMNNDQVTADHDIGDDVPFHIHIDLGSNISYYKHYDLIVTDTLSKGFTLKPDSFVVKIEGQTVSASKYAITTARSQTVAGATEITIDFEDLAANGVKNYQSITIDYVATLNENAVIGAAGNPNTAAARYSNNPNDETSYGSTPESTVVVYTYQLTVKKVDGNNQPLNGASFKLYKYYYGTEWDEGVEITGTDSNTFVFTGLDDGLYKLEETVEPGGFNKLEHPIVFEITADHSGVLVVDAAAQGGSGAVFSHEAEGEGDNAATIQGKLITAIKNEKGTTLPSTGGMGTTVLYTAGGILVLVAIVLLITKKRMKDAE